MANIEAQIKPNGMTQRNLVDVLYMIVASIKGICAKLDLDDNTDNTYVATSFTAIFNGSIQDSRGNIIQNRVAPTLTTNKDDRFFIITPTGLTDGALLECLYQIFDMIETLTEQCDADNLTTSNYESLIYTALYLWRIENVKGEMLGNSTDYTFGPGATGNTRELVNLVYAIVKSIETLTKKLDADAVPAGADYEALWFTASILLRVENAQGSVVGNTITITP